MGAQFEAASSSSTATRESAYTTAVTSLQTVLKNIYGSTYSCFFAID